MPQTGTPAMKAAIIRYTKDFYFHRVTPEQVIASSGAGCPEHFLEVFTGTAAESSLAAVMFHRREVPIGDVKGFLEGKVAVRP